MSQVTYTRVGRIVSALTVLFLLFDATIHLIRIGPVVDAFAELGFPIGVAAPLGVVELICLTLYLIPRTAALGAILWTGYLGGAVAANLRIGAPLVSHVLFPVYVGSGLWAGLLLRNERVRALFPVQSRS